MGHVGPYLGKVCKALACRAIVDGGVHLAVDQVQVAIAGVRCIQEIDKVVVFPIAGGGETFKVGSSGADAVRGVQNFVALGSVQLKRAGFDLISFHWFAFLNSAQVGSSGTNPLYSR